LKNKALKRYYKFTSKSITVEELLYHLFN